jgi:two-component system chemotaxis sensor kinase CheA
MPASSLAIQFVLEAREHCDTAAHALLDLETHRLDAEIVGSIFRSFHTIKGTSGIFAEYGPITHLTHAAEDLMDLVRNGQLPLDSTLIDLFLAVLDQVSAWLDSIEDCGDLPVEATERSAPLRTRLAAAKGQDTEEQKIAAISVAEQEDSPHLARLHNWIAGLSPELRVSLAARLKEPDAVLTAVCYQPAAEAFFFGDDPINLLRELPNLVELKVFTPPGAKISEDYDPYNCRLYFMALAAVASGQVENLFEYVADQTAILLCTPETFQPAGFSTPESSAADSTETLPAPLASGGAEGSATSKKSNYIRVDQQQISLLMDLVGEMIIAKNTLPYLALRADRTYRAPQLASEIEESHSTLNHLVGRLQDTTLQMRMLPVLRAFERFPRLVRDLSRKLNKQVRLVMSGEETQADKDVIDLLGDPLIHLVRNSLDHGIELPDERIAGGKPAEATICLRAYQDKAEIIVEVEDDGRGIDPAVIRAKALARGLLSAEAAAVLGDEEAIQLIMAAGFSTAEAVSDLSGRGVGMDVVQSMVTSLGGSVRAFSTPGKGSCMRLTLPLSMAISKILIVTQSDCHYGIPADDVVESMIDLPLSRINTVTGAPGLEVRGELLPLYHLGALFNTAPADGLRPGFAAVVIRARGERIALAVDSLQDINDVVVKPLSGCLRNYSGYSGSTILGDGAITLILNVAEVLKNAHSVQ